MNSNKPQQDVGSVLQGADDLVQKLLGEFVSQLQVGRPADIDEFCQQAGEQAGALRPLLQTAMLLESARQQIADEQTRAFAGSRFDAAPTNSAGNVIAEVKRLGDFRLLRVAGRGGMGVVYEAIEESLQRRVAVKVLDERFASSDIAAKRFEREARAAAQLHHTNIVPVFSVNDERGVHFYVMPFIDGMTLASLLTQLRRKASDTSGSCLIDSDLRSDVVADQDSATGICLSSGTIVVGNDQVKSEGTADEDHPVDTGTVRPQKSQSEVIVTTQKDASYFRRVASIGLQVADALEYASARGVLHRDIKPGNLLVDLNGTVWVSDFGLARLAEDGDLTSTGEVLGTMRYMAPERFSGQHTVAGDLYGLGTVMYELLTLERVFDASDRAALLHQILNQSPRRPGSIDSSIPRDLETVVLKLLAKDPALRYASAKELAIDLRLILQDRPIRSRRVGVIESTLRWSHRNPWIAALLSCVMLLLIVIAVGSALNARSLKAERDTAREATQTAVNASRRAEQAMESALKSQRAAETAEKQKSAALDDLRIVNRQHRLELFRAYITEMKTHFQSGRTGQRLNGLAAAKKILEVIPFTELTPQQQLELCNATTAALSLGDLEPVRETPIPIINAEAVDIHPDFTFVAFPGPNSNTIIRPVGDGADIELNAHDGRTYHQSERNFSPCGRWLIERIGSPGLGEKPATRVWDWRNRRLVLDVEKEDLTPSNAVDSTGRWLHIIEDPTISRYDLETGERIFQSPRVFPYSNLALSPDGNRLACLVRNQSPMILDAQTYEIRHRLDGIAHSGSATWSAGGDFLLIGQKNDHVLYWNPEANDSYPISSSTTIHPGRLQISLDSSTVAASIPGSQLFNPNSSRPTLSDDGIVMRFSGDSSRLAMQRNDKVSIERIIHPAAVDDFGTGAETVRFSPDGRWLAAAGYNGVSVFSTHPLRHAANMDMDSCGPVAWHPDGSELITFGIFSHLSSWPVERTGHSSLEIKTPSPLMLNPVLARLGADDNIPQHSGRHSVWMPDGKSLLIGDRRHGRLLKWNRDARKVIQWGECLNPTDLSLSHDGRWLAVGCFPPDFLKVFDVATGQELLHADFVRKGSFSTDGQWMAVGSYDKIQLYRTSDWTLQKSWSADQVGMREPCSVAFCPGTSILAYATTDRLVRLRDVESEQTIVDLPCEDSGQTNSLTFSPDGADLSIARSSSIRIWHLGILREQLRELGIAADSLPANDDRSAVTDLSEAPQVSINRGTDLLPPGQWWTGHETRARFEAIQGNFQDAINAINDGLTLVHRGDNGGRWKLLTLRASYYEQMHDSHSASEDLKAAIRLRPDDIVSCRKLAEFQLFGPSLIQDPESAMRLLQQVAESGDSSELDRLHLSMALIMNHRPTAAGEVLNRRIAIREFPIVIPKIGMTLHRDLSTSAGADVQSTRNGISGDVIADANAEDGDIFVTPNNSGTALCKCLRRILTIKLELGHIDQSTLLPEFSDCSEAEQSQLQQCIDLLNSVQQH